VEQIKMKMQLYAIQFAKKTGMVLDQSAGILAQVIGINVELFALPKLVNVKMKF